MSKPITIHLTDENEDWTKPKKGKGKKKDEKKTKTASAESVVAAFLAQQPTPKK
jgi:hypothetical protein